MRIVILSLFFTVAGVLLIKENAVSGYIDGQNLNNSNAVIEDLDNYYSLPY
jgi:hypothetical protein